MLIRTKHTKQNTVRLLIRDLRYLHNSLGKKKKLGLKKKSRPRANNNLNKLRKH